jgi:hypothetical protein
VRVAADGRICGVSAVILRGLLRRERFTTVDAMKAFLVHEPQITDLLAELEAVGWIMYMGPVNREDWWEGTEQGHRLTATKIVKRIPQEVGWQLLNQVVDQARALNIEPTRSQRISAIYLFGSLLTGSDDGTVGDVDLVVDTARRAVSREEYDRLRLAEIGDRHVGFGGWAFGSNALRKALLKVSRSISIHDEVDLQLPGVSYRQVYAFDVGHEREVPFDAADRVHPEPFTGNDLASPDRPACFPDRQFREWPKAPSRFAKCRIHQAEALLAQHLWQNGASAKEIAERTRCSRSSVLTYLSSHQLRPEVTPIIDASLGSTVASALPDQRSIAVTATVEMGRAGSACVVIVGLEPDTFNRVGRIHYRSAREALFQDIRHDAVAVIEAAGSAALAWRDKMKSRVGGLELEAGSYLPADKLPKSTGLTMLDFRPLEAPMRAALEALWPHPRGDGHSVRLKVVIDNPHRSPITFCEGGGLGEAESRVPANLTAPINDVLRPLRKHWAAALSWDTSYTVSLTGRQLTKGTK